jgi:hypothetical protein
METRRWVERRLRKMLDAKCTGRYDGSCWDDDVDASVPRWSSNARWIDRSLPLILLIYGP